VREERERKRLKWSREIEDVIKHIPVVRLGEPEGSNRLASYIFVYIYNIYSDCASLIMTMDNELAVYLLYRI
jgi:hypothetical protein